MYIGTQLCIITNNYLEQYIIISKLENERAQFCKKIYYWLRMILLLIC